MKLPEPAETPANAVGSNPLFGSRSDGCKPDFPWLEKSCVKCGKPFLPHYGELTVCEVCVRVELSKIPFGEESAKLR